MRESVGAFTESISNRNSTIIIEVISGSSDLISSDTWHGNAIDSSVTWDDVVVVVVYKTTTA